MKDVPENELLSAYLDGELTAEEQAEVEQLLATSPAARQVVDELRALSSSLQALPCYQIGEDISQQVLHLADQTWPDPPAAPERPKGTTEQPEGPVWRAMIRRFTRPRNLVWASAAVAAALLLAVIQWGQLSGPGGREIARDMRTEDAPAATSRGAAPMEADVEEAPEKYADMATQSPPLPEAEMPPPARRGAGPGFVSVKAGPGDSASAPAGPDPATPPASKAPPAAPAAEPTAAPAPVAAGEDPFGGMGVGRRIAKEAGPIEPPRPGKGVPSKDRPAFAMKKGKAGDEATVNELSPDSKADQPPPVGQRPAPALVVACWGTPAAFEKLGFERLLEETSVRQLATAGLEAAKVRLRAAASEAGRRDSYPTQGKASGARQIVDVEVTREQLAGLIANMQRQTDLSSLAYVTPGHERLPIDGQRSRADLDSARAFQMILGRGDDQRPLGRMAVEKLLDSMQRNEAQYEMSHKARLGVMAEGESAAEEAGVQARSAPEETSPQARLRIPAELPKGGATTFGSGAGRPAAARESRLPAPSPAPPQVAAPTAPAPGEPQAEMAAPAEQRPADEEEREADESHDQRAGQRSQPGPTQEGKQDYARAKKPEQPAPVAAGAQLDRYAGTYYVRFEFHLVDGPDVAASLAQDAAEAMMAEEPPMASEAAAEPPAPAAPPAVEER